MASKPSTEATGLVGTEEGEGVTKKVYNKLTLKRSLKRRRLNLSSDGTQQKDKPAVKRVLFNLPKRRYKWQRYKIPKQTQVPCSKSKRLSSIIKKLSENVPPDICTDIGERPMSGDDEQVDTDCVEGTDVTDLVTSEPLLCLDNDSSQGLTIEAGPSEDSGKTTYAETLDVSLRIADDDTDSIHCMDSGLHHLKMLTEELSQLGRDSARLATSQQLRKPLKKRKRQLDEYMESQVRTSSPKSHVRQQADCDSDETPVSDGLSSIRLQTPDKKRTKGGDEAGTLEGETEGVVSESEEMEVIDDTLEEKSKKFLLSAKNVRSIVHEVITNKDVLAMICNTIQGTDGNESPKAAVYEPKMTRSKLKEVLEMGQLPSPWILSPIKSTPVDANTDPHFLEMIFSEDEEDEEYVPTETELKALSEFGSEVGTPIPSCSSLPEEEENPVEASSAKCDDALPGPSEAATIAWRTRSKLPLQNTPLEQIELGFVAPDISADMYDTYCDDTDWKNFLCSFVKNDVKPDINDSMDDEADPEYNFLAEAEKEEFDVEDFRDDREVRVSKKELHQLMDELFDAYGASGHEPSLTTKPARDPAKAKKQKDTSAENDPEPHIKLVGDLPLAKVEQPAPGQSKDAAAIPLVTEEERVQIQDQMRKHVQLLTQTYVQASSRPELPDLTNLARLFLLELKGLGDKASLPPGRTSFLHPPNLPSAIDIVSRPLPEYDQTCNEDLKRLMIANFVPKNMYEVYGLNYEQMEIFMTSRAFVFPQMLPECHLLHAGDHQGKSRVLFSQAEDNLLAMGIDQFGHLPNKYAFIEQYVLPTKKKQQLRYRLKNLKADRTTGENSIKHLSKHTRLPDFPRYLELENPQDMVPPQDRDPDLLPEWCEAFRATRLNHESSCQAESTGIPGWVQVGSVASPVGSDVEKKTTQVQRKKPHAHSRRKRSRKRVGVSGLNQFHMGDNKSPAKSSLSSLSTVGAAHEKALVKDGVVQPVSGCEENDTAGSPENIVINAAVLSPGGSAAVKMATMSKPGFRSASPVVSGDAVGIDEPLIMLTARQLSQLGVKINISSPSVADIQVPAGSSDVQNTVLLSSGPNTVKDDVASESEVPSIVARSNVTESTSVPATVHQQTATQTDGEVDQVSDVAPSLVEHIGNDDGVNADTLDALCHDDADTACTVDQGVAGIDTIPVDSTIVHTTTNVTTGDTVTVDAVSESMDLPVASFASTDVVTCSEIAPHATTAGGENKTPQKTPPQKHTPPSKTFLSSSPSRKSTVFHRLHKPHLDTSKAKKAISILPHPVSATSTADFSAGSPFYQSPSKQITFLQPSEVSVNRNLGFSLRSPSKNHASNRRGHAVFISPLKKAAAKITARLKKVRPLRKLDRILPKSVSSSIIAAAFFGSSDSESCDVSDVNTSVGIPDCEEVRRRPDVDHVTLRDDVIGGESESDGEGVRGAPGRPESATEYEDEDNDDEDHLAQLMEASTTIRFAPKLPLSGTDICLTKAKKKRAVLLELLVPDLVAKDPLRDERDTAFAQAYLTTAREVLLSNNRADIYEQLLKLLHDFGQSERSPVELYGQLKTMLVDFPQLSQEFVVFLLPEQAKECDCFMENLESQHATTFLRKLEVHLRKHPSHLQKIINVFLQWHTSKGSRDVSQLKEAIKPLLRGQQHLLDEFCWFFNDEEPPQSSLTEFEEVTMKDSDDEDMSGDDSYEEVELPEGDELLGSQWCKCQCHQSDVMLLQGRKKHCRACKSSGIKIIKGRIYVQASESSLKPARVVFHSPPDSRGDLESSDSHSAQCQTLSQESKVDSVTVDNQSIQPPASSHDSRSDVESFDNHTTQGQVSSHDSISDLKSVGNHTTQPQVSSHDSRSDIESFDNRAMQHQALSQESNVDLSLVDNDATPLQAETNNDSVKMQLGGGNVDQAGSPAQTISNRCPSEPTEDARSPHAPTVDSRPQTTATVCGTTTVEDCHADMNPGECVGDEETDRDRGSPSATDLVSNPGMDDNSTTVVVASSCEDTAGTNVGQENTGSKEGKDTVVPCDDASRQFEDSLPGANGASLPESSWTKEEDKQILESCKQHGLGGSTFQTIASVLNKSADSVSQRFYELMQLFNEQPSDPSENDSDNDSDGSPAS